VLERVRGVQAGYMLRTGLWRGADPCQGLFAGYELVRPGFSLLGRVSACRGGYSNDVVTSTADEVSFQIEGAHVWDLRAGSLQVGLAAGPSWLREGFETRGVAPARDALAGVVTASVGAELPIKGRFAATFALAANVHLFKQRDAEQSAEWATPVTLMTRVGLAARW